MTDLQDFLAVLDLTPTGEGTFSTTSLDHGHGVVFGGQLLAQTIAAADATLTDKEVKSVELLFARGASATQPIEIEVEPMHDGRAFASRSVTIRQGDRLCTRALVLAHVPDDDLIRHAASAPVVADPRSIAPRQPDSWWDLRIVDDVDVSDPEAVGPPELHVWTRFVGAPDDLPVNQALLAYASDGFLIGTAMRPHRGVGQSQAHVTVSTTVLSHALTFHEPFRAAEWLLLAHESSYAGRGRAYGRADVFTEDGRLVASFGQESMIRDVPEGRRPAAGERASY